MSTSKVTYTGNLRTTCEHLASGTKIITDAPTDNHGKGEAFSPTDLVATAYGACVITTIGIFSDLHNIHFEHGTCEVTKVMASDPRRISRIILNIDLSGNGWDEKTQKEMMNVAKTCPVARTLGGNVEAEFTFSF